jgi:dihydrofolate reductase
MLCFRRERVSTRAGTPRRRFSSSKASRKPWPRRRSFAGDRMVEVAAGEVGGQVLAAGLIDEVRMDVVPVVFGSGKRYFGSVHAQHLLEEPDVVLQGNRVLHLRYRVRR